MPTSASSGSGAANEGKTPGLGVAFTYSQIYGFDSIPAIAEGGREAWAKECEVWARAMALVLAGDNEASEEEIRYARGFLSSKGYPEDVVSRVEEWANEAAKMTREEMASEMKAVLSFNESISKAGPAILYAGISAANADGLAQGEVEEAIALGEMFGITKEEVEGLVQLVKDEEALRLRRVKAFFPMGHPNLGASFKPGNSK